MSECQDHMGKTTDTKTTLRFCTNLLQMITAAAELLRWYDQQTAFCKTIMHSHLASLRKSEEAQRKSAQLLAQIGGSEPLLTSIIRRQTAA